MDALTRDDVKEIALLARLALSEEEIEELRGELTTILAHMEALSRVDTEGVDPMTHPVAMTLRLRDDSPSASFASEVATAQAPESEDGNFRVPHVIKSATSSRRQSP